MIQSRVMRALAVQWACVGMAGVLFLSAFEGVEHGRDLLGDIKPGRTVSPAARFSSAPAVQRAYRIDQAKDQKRRAKYQQDNQFAAHTGPPFKQNDFAALLLPAPGYIVSNKTFDISLHTLLLVNTGEYVSIRLDIELHTDVPCVYGVIPCFCLVLRAPGFFFGVLCGHGVGLLFGVTLIV